jgi:threonine/homoserine/homoserine lactone efflux protein
MLDPVSFVLAVLTVLAIPGPTNTLLATSAALVGAKRSLPLIAAEVLGYLTAIIALHLVLGGLIAAHPAAAMRLRLVLAVYLVGLAVRLWTHPPAASGASAAIGPYRVFIATVLNPKAALFAFAILPLAHAGAPAYLAAFAGLVMLAGLGWIAVGSLARSWVPGAGGLAPRLAALALAGFAGIIAVH